MLRLSRRRKPRDAPCISFQYVGGGGRGAYHCRMTHRINPPPMPTLTLAADRSFIRSSGHSVRYLHARITAPAAPRDRIRPPVHAAFSLDRSGSMAGAKLELAKAALETALGHLAATDRFAVVTFDDVVALAIPATFATAAAIDLTRTKLRDVDSGGSTALCDGWLRACSEVAAPNPAGGSPAPVARCFLLTDGEANVGEVDPMALAQHAADQLARGVRTVTFGLGDAFNEALLQGIATAGGGHFYHVEHAAQIGDFFTSELGEALDVVSRDVRLMVRAPAPGTAKLDRAPAPGKAKLDRAPAPGKAKLDRAPGVKCRPLTAYAVSALDADRTIVRVGDLTSEQVIELVFELTFPDGAIGDSVEVLAQLLADGRVGPTLDNPLGDVPTTGVVRFTFASHAANDQQPRERAVDRIVAESYAAQARQNAVAKNRAGDLHGAERELVATAKKIFGYAHGDDALLALAAALMTDGKRYAEPLPEMVRKRAFASATSHLKGRDSDGRARRS